jgi:hypothetical protein
LATSPGPSRLPLRAALPALTDPALKGSETKVGTIVRSGG